MELGRVLCFFARRFRCLMGGRDSRTQWYGLELTFVHTNPRRRGLGDAPCRRRKQVAAQNGRAFGASTRACQIWKMHSSVSRIKLGKGATKCRPAEDRKSTRLNS